MARLPSLAFALIFVAGCARLAGCTGDWAIDRIEERWNDAEGKEDLITFRNGKTWENLGMKAEKIAEIAGPEGSRAIAFKALSCVECEPDLLLTIRSTAGEKVVSEPYPGRMTALDLATGVRAPDPFAETRAFYGKCLDGTDAEAFVVESTALPEKRTILRAIRPTNSGLEIVKLEKLPEALRSLGCHEIASVDRDVED
jgi:hypothetical protein